MNMSYMIKLFKNLKEEENGIIRAKGGCARK